MSNTPVIAAVDGSEHSLRALEWARKEAVRHDTGLLVAHVLPDHAQLYAGRRASLHDASEPQEFADPVRDWVRSLLGGDDSTLPEGVTYEALEGSVPEALRVIGSQARMLVMGSRGRGGFASLLLGSNSRAVASTAACPVVVVPHAERGAHPDADAERSAGRVVLGLHAAETPDDVLTFAFTEAAVRGTTVQVVSAYAIPPSPTLVMDSPFAVIPPEGLADEETGYRPNGRCCAPRRSGWRRCGSVFRTSRSSRPRCPGTRRAGWSSPPGRRRWSWWAATTRGAPPCHWRSARWPMPCSTTRTDRWPWSRPSRTTSDDV